MAKKNEEQLATVSTQALATPDYIGQGRLGFETVDAKDVMFERLALMQDLSPDVKSKAFEVGDIVRRSTGEVLYRRGGAPIKITILYYFKEYVEFGDRNDPSQPVVISRTLNRDDPLAEEARQWVKKKQGDGKLVRKVTDVHNFIVLVNGRLLEPVLLGCMRSGNKQGVGLLALANSRGNVPIYAGQYLLTSADETNKRNQTYSVFRFKICAEEPWAPKEVFDAAAVYYKQMVETFKSGKLTGDYTPDDAVDGEVVPGEPDKDL